MSASDGGPAYPLPRGENQVDGTEGMSLRDYFAGQALAGYCAHPDLGTELVDKLAKWSYQIADAMLAERDKPGAPHA